MGIQVLDRQVRIHFGHDGGPKGKRQVTRNGCFGPLLSVKACGTVFSGKSSFFQGKGRPPLARSLTLSIGDAYRQVKARLAITVNDLGDTRLKNIVEPVRVYSLAVVGANEANTPTGGDRASLDKPTGRPAPSIKPSIAVLAFQNMSGDAEQEYFSDGISEDIITDLSKLSELHVIARNSSFIYRHLRVSAPNPGHFLAPAFDCRFVGDSPLVFTGSR